MRKKVSFAQKKNKLETNRITQSSQAVMALSQHEKVLGKVKVKALSLQCKSFREKLIRKRYNGNFWE